MPTPTDILMFAPKELRGTVATLVGDLVDRSDLFRGMQEKNIVRQMDPIAQAQQNAGLPIPSGGRVAGTINPKGLKVDPNKLSPSTRAASAQLDRLLAEPGMKAKLALDAQNKRGAYAEPSAKDSAQTSFGPVPVNALDTLRGFKNNPNTLIPSKRPPMSEADWKKVNRPKTAKEKAESEAFRVELQKVAKEIVKAADITSRAPKDPRLPLKEIQAAQGKQMEMARKGNEAFDKKWSEWGSKQGLDPAKAAKAARDVWTQAAMRNLPEPTEQQMKYLIALMIQRGEI